MTDHFDRSEFRFGSAGLAGEADIRRAGLFAEHGPELGFFRGRPLRLTSDAPLITFSGSGGGKLTTSIAGNVLKGLNGMPAMIFDPRGEIFAIAGDHLARIGERAYGWGARPMHGMPVQPCNPLAFLTLDSPDFHNDCASTMAEWVPGTGGGSDGRYFELRAQDILTVIATARVEQFGKTSMTDIYRVVMTIEGNPHAWADQLDFMLFRSQFEHVRNIAGEILRKQEDSPREFGSILGEISAQMGFMHDPGVQAALEGGGFDLSCLIGPNATDKVFLNVPAEHIGRLSPVIRIFFTVIMILKGRAPGASRLVLMVDEAGQLGKFATLLRAYTFARGGGTRVWAFFQDIGQIERNYGRAAIQTFIGSAQVRQFFGIRDYDTARLISDMIGQGTLEYDDELRQEDARRRRAQLIREVMTGGDPFAAAADLRYQSFASTHATKQARQVFSPDEILNLPEDKQILFVSGKSLPPILAERRRYFERQDLAGTYVGNPYHPPVDHVQVATRFGRKELPVLECQPPAKIADFPQLAGRPMRYVTGYPFK